VKAFILLVEDDSMVRQNLIELLEAESFEVIPANHGAQAMEVLEHFVPDVIICDVMMPIMDGHALLQNVRSQRNLADIPFIFLTAKADPVEQRRGMTLGADDYLTKPFTREQLLSAIAIRIQKRDLMRAKYNEQLDSLRNSISGTLPHELRTPLTGIIGFAEYLLDNLDTTSPEETREFLTFILNSGKRLHRLIENYVTYSDLQMKKLSMNNTNFSTSVGMSILETLTQIAQNKSYEFERSEDLVMDIDDAELFVDERDSEKIFTEIIDNSFRFSRTGTKVKIVGRQEETMYMVRIIDSGIGMSPEQVASIGAYVQFDRQKHEQQGSGLGITIARGLVELLGGRFSIQSADGVGTTVECRLPFNG
jgi:two-component system sensor histidine kinase/response regulator